MSFKLIKTESKNMLRSDVKDDVRFLPQGHIGPGSNYQLIPANGDSGHFNCITKSFLAKNAGRLFIRISSQTVSTPGYVLDRFYCVWTTQNKRVSSTAVTSFATYVTIDETELRWLIIGLCRKC